MKLKKKKKKNNNTCISQLCQVEKFTVFIVHTCMVQDQWMGWEGTSAISQTFKSLCNWFSFAEKSEAPV